MFFEKVIKLCQDKNISIAKLERECEMGNGNISTQLLPSRIQTSLRNSRKLQTAGMRLFRKT